jgi:hypothetical protein
MFATAADDRIMRKESSQVTPVLPGAWWKLLTSISVMT